MEKKFVTREELISSWINDPAFINIEPQKAGLLIEQVLKLLVRGGYDEKGFQTIKFSSNCTAYGEPIINVYNGTDPLGNVYIDRDNNVQYSNWALFDPKQNASKQKER